MGNLNVKIGNVGNLGNATKTYEANSAPLETKTLGINGDKSNDFSVPLKFGDEGPTVYLRPDQVDAMKMALASATKNEDMGNLFGNGGPSVSVSVNGQAYTMSAREMQAQLSGHGALTAGS
ncbi:hypothetical protein COW36_09740 [bacterium (Candidatus Blackallbacteria) CG17_big_fil_post_rev_8_21_14_2_50_48_46]|uniref:Uncharacterized protein n=1 Tax=bacterium (Candidatus Blackallbacteria) CG17_big_fil_post_rev_8_21_14_2_50_48_46 TaxID=2014261 RepID=A0A2M7G5H1_9BACT|nr:MAG: hypothetical protein COW64_01670 [bacterium (Candidatus Blackallbacteria) CG18_big_fil_WC_8_21_14_2_50_49_26]PIW17241.1 MAG: hypothetical protein COW36_09740 [bacterium (Candidatus Blackallbacteria) CG17_big_fil_post_rev_8_21_14_2_50_48_46]PIW51033.1 MAG: hypothetical protein COW20_00750 [bacterium (Candidatus Blackallbacteria) CG13_big_fil_rev_8_21_14_2_50_49_14]